MTGYHAQRHCIAVPVESTVAIYPCTATSLKSGDLEIITTSGIYLHMDNGRERKGPDRSHDGGGDFCFLSWYDENEKEASGSSMSPFFYLAIGTLHHVEIWRMMITSLGPFSIVPHCVRSWRTSDASERICNILWHPHHPILLVHGDNSHTCSCVSIVSMITDGIYMYIFIRIVKDR